MRLFLSLVILCLLAHLGAGSSDAASLPNVGLVSRYLGADLDGIECVEAARRVTRAATGLKLPALGADGVAADLWDVRTTSFRRDFRRVSIGRGTPNANAVLVWSRKLGDTGHLAVVLGSPSRGVVRVVEGNWTRRRGGIRDVRLDDSKLLGWFEPILASEATPSTPRLLRPSDGTRVTAGTVTFAWSSASNATGYELVVEVRSGRTWSSHTALSTERTEARVALRAGRSYRWYVLAKNRAGTTKSATAEVSAR